MATQLVAPTRWPLFADIATIHRAQERQTAQPSVHLRRVWTKKRKSAVANQRAPLGRIGPYQREHRFPFTALPLAGVIELHICLDPTILAISPVSPVPILPILNTNIKPLK